MKITIIHGQSHKGSTYNIANMLAEKLNGEVTEFFLPKDFGEFCVGCNSCFLINENKCPHYNKLIPITEALNSADLIILASPVYVFHATGAMKSLLDHYGYRWMVHRPEERMFKKQAVCISTAAGAGMKSTNKDMGDSLFFWGIGKVYKLGFRVEALNYESVSEKNKAKIDNKISKLADKIIKNNGKVEVDLKTKAFFYLMLFMQKRGWNKADEIYWQSKGWAYGKRPWK